MAPRGKLGVAVVGCGYWGGNYLRLLHAIGPGCAVACDSDAARREDAARRYPSTPVEPDYRRAVERPDVGAVVVATPAAQHHPVARAALEAGRDVLVEKPLTLTSAEGRDLVALARDRGRTLMVGHTFLYHPAVGMMRDYLQRGELGSVYYVHAARTHLGLVRRDVNAVWDLATHDISIFNYLLGALPVSVSATGGSYLSRDHADVAFISLTYPGGIVGSIFVSWVDSNKVRQVAVVGSRARVLFDDLNNLEKLRIYEKGVSLDRPYSDFGEFQLLVRDGDIVSPRVEASEPLRRMTEHFLACVADGKEPMTGGKDGLDVVLILEAIDRSLQARGAPIDLAWGTEPVR